ncbi:ABC transporter ATP-binding protein [Brevibacillus brevis]|uniref:ABC transporter ATP-binding protein n=1 Tax=Brevibacillus brevis TaxID=1393 RepID=A0A517I5G5_BREBE|nr:ABC transporter ATP-binding protein [Brevibacillus brevis]QDS34143.1 ABC transporter ATP-binding protein [Brevibacillus brevis]
MVDNIVGVENLAKSFEIGGGHRVRAVDRVSFEIRRGETLGIVGESGCGKSTLGRTIVGLYPASAGRILFQGKDIARMDRRGRREANRHMQLIFQDPQASLNPRLRVGDIIAEGIDSYGLAKGKEREERIYQLLELVGLHPSHAKRFPHEFSGGQRQRIGIARALAVEPSFIVADESISALDVSIQAQIVNLLADLQAERSITYLFIAHDLSMVKHISDRIGVMYLGQMMELAPSEQLFATPLHPYTQALISAMPVSHPAQREEREQIVLTGEPPSPIHPPSGCPFRTRCPVAQGVCAETAPDWKEVRHGHWIACHLVQ